MNKKVTIKDLVPDDANFNTGNEFGNSLIDKSLSKFGAGRSILIDKNNRIIAGNKTIENAAANGFNDVVVVETTGDQIVAVKRTDIDLNTKKGREMALADNATAKANISWDAQALTDWDMPTAEWGIDLAEFAVEEVGEADAEPQIDKAAELNKKWKVKSGDLWQIGEHRLLCGDSTTGTAKLMGGVKADMVFTDPPYGMFLDTDFDQMFAADDRHRKTGDRFDKVVGDNEDFNPLLIESIFSNFGDTDEIFIWGADYFCEFIPDRAKGSWVVWDKRLDENMDKVSGNTFELCWSKQKHKRLIARILWSGHHGMHKDDTKTRVHPTQKPTELVKWFFGNWGKVGDLVVDVFAGSGTTLVACQNLNRKCYAIEISENYCAVILERMATAFPDIEIKRIDG